MTVEKIKDWVFDVGCVAQYIQITRERLPKIMDSGLSVGRNPGHFVKCPAGKVKIKK